MGEAATAAVERKQQTHFLDLATQPTKRLRTMVKAGEDILEIYRVLAKTKSNVVGEILRDQGTFYEWDHYPKGDVYDHDTHSQYFYHAHPGGLRDKEHGHFHTFVRAKGMPATMKPKKHANTEQWPKGKDALTHIVGISMDAKGLPLRLFTTNRWVTGETWYKASDVCKLIGHYEIGHAQPSWPTNRWVTNMVKLFWPQIIMLLKARDTVIDQWQEQNPSGDVLEDRGLEVTSQAELSIEGQLDAARAALAGKK